MIDREFGKGLAQVGLTDRDAIMMREMARDMIGTMSNEDIVRILATEFRIAEEVVNKILDGEIEPYVGGPLRPLPLQGCNPKYLESTRNRQRFVKGVIMEARLSLSDEEFAIFANFNGMTLDEAEAHLENMGAVRDRSDSTRYRSILRRHAEGQTIEQAVSLYAKRLKHAVAG